jgi:hypothetical protein
MITIPEADIAAAIDRLIAERLTPEEIERRVTARIDERIGLLTVDDIAARWRLTKPVTERILRRTRAAKVYLSQKSVRYRITEIERIETERESKSPIRRVSRGSFSLAA